jgi:hypothetical protein
MIHSGKIREEPPVVVGRGEQRGRQVVPDTMRAWQWAGRLALVLTVAALADWAIALVPPSFGQLEWEFGTLTAIMSGLPLVAIGFAGILASELARGRRTGIIVASVATLLLAFAILGGLILYSLDAPVALSSVQGVAHLGVSKAIAKTLTMGILFLIAFSVAGIAGLRHALRDLRIR